MRTIFKMMMSFLTLLYLCSFAQAGELWTHMLPTSRYYLSIKSQGRSLLLRHFSQSKGEYQTLLSTTKFQNKTDIDNYVARKFPNYKEEKSLELWPINSSFEKNNDKIFGGKKNQYIWAAKNQWSEEWENKYSKWLQEEVTASFYQRYKIPTDCADALVGLRWIFSRINSLPVANTLADSGNLFGNFSMIKNWKKYETAEKWNEDELFLAALDFVMNLTSTRTVINDGYPVSLDTKGLVPGTYIITQNGVSGHARIITETHYNEVTELPLHTLASTVPREVRELTKEAFLDQDWPSKGVREILAFRWPVVSESGWSLQKRNARANYSEEQFDPAIRVGIPSLIQLIFSRVKESYDPVKLVEIAIGDILNSANQRILIINQGYEFCKKNNCRPGSTGDEDWGTPSRDAKLLKKFHDIDSLVRQFEALSPGLYDRWIAGLRNTTFTVEGVPLKLTSLRFIMENNLFSSLATDTPARRWGLSSEDLLSNWSDAILKLLSERNVVMNKEQVCGNDCHPKTYSWVVLNTYHIDSELNKIYTQVNTYCSLVNSKTCHSFFSTVGDKPLTYNNEIKSFKAWFDLIPFFHADPRVDSNRRWGNISEGIIARALPYADSVKISKNNLALLDMTKVMNLNSGKIIFESSKNSRVVLTAQGIVYNIDDKKAEISRVLFNGNDTTLLPIVDTDGFLSLEKDRTVYIEESGDHTVFRKPISSDIITFRINNDKIEFIKEHNGAFSQNGALLTLALDKNTMSFIDLDRNQDIELKLDNSNEFFDMKYMKISSYKYPHVLLNYLDRDHGFDYSVLVDLKQGNWFRVAPSVEENYLTLWSDANLKKALIQTKYNQEFPQLYAVSWNESNQFQVQKLNNLLKGVETLNGLVYFIDAKGGAWDQNTKTRLFEWAKELSEIPGPNETYEVKFLTSFGAYYSSNAKGVLRLFSDSNDFILPKELLADGSFCQIQSKAKEIFSYRFNSTYGDYGCMGGSLLESRLTSSKEELPPQFSQYAWINENSLLDVQWKKSFIDFDVESGLLIGIGRNINIWWSGIE